jgi:hypothetical protein
LNDRHNHNYTPALLPALHERKIVEGVPKLKRQAELVRSLPRRHLDIPCPPRCIPLSHSHINTRRTGLSNLQLINHFTQIKISSCSSIAEGEVRKQDFSRLGPRTPRTQFRNHSTLPPCHSIKALHVRLEFGYRKKARPGTPNNIQHPSGTQN